MAVKSKTSKSNREKQGVDYNREVKELRENGPRSLYFLYGPEVYLRDYYLEELKKTCLPDGDDGFSLKRLNGPELDVLELGNAIDALPFFSPRTFIEIHDADVNKLSDSDAVIKLLNQIPDYCTVVFIQDFDYEPDGRSKFIKFLKENATELYFSAQSQEQLIKWILRRFVALGKKPDLEAVQRLIFVSGDLMSSLIPEIEKISAAVPGERITIGDVNRLAHHIPEAVVFDLVGHIAKREYNSAFVVLEEVLSDRTNEPIAVLALLSYQFKRLFAAKLAAEHGKNYTWLNEKGIIKSSFQAKDYWLMARSFPLDTLRFALHRIAEADFASRNGVAAQQAMSEALLLICARCKYAENQ